MRALSPRKYYKTIELTCPKLNWKGCIGNVIRKAKIVEEVEIKINKNLISIFNEVFLSLTSPKFGGKCKQIQYKFLILRTSSYRSSKAIFGVFWHIWLSLPAIFGQFKSKFLTRKRNSRYLEATGTNFIQIVFNSRLGRLKMSSPYFFVSYPMLPNVL